MEHDKVSPVELLYSQDPEINTEIALMASYWDEDSRVFLIPESDDSELMNYIPLEDMYSLHKASYDPRLTYPEGDEGDIEYQNYATYRHEYNFALRSYLESLGWAPEDWEICDFDE